MAIALACGDTSGPDPEPKTQIAFQSTRVTGYPGIFLMDGDGRNVRPVVSTTGKTYSSPSLSPDGTRIAFESDLDGKVAVYAVGVDGTGLTKITSDTFPEGEPAWSPDGSRIVLVRTAQTFGNSGMFTVNPDGTGLTLIRDSGVQPTWSPDGSRIAFIDFGTASGNNESLYLMNPDGTGVVELVSIPGSMGDPAWAPDGTRIAFGGTGNGTQEVFVVNADGANLVNITNTSDPLGEIQPVWSPDGKSIAFTGFRNGNQEIVRRNADGSGEIVLTHLAARDMHPSWSVLP
jgi:Tol biopolymer transport system component